MIIPENGNILLKPIEEEEQTYGNIVVPDLGKEKARMYEVIDTSHTYNYHTDKNVISVFEKGDKVFIPAFGGTKVMDGNVEYVLIKETEILGTYE